MVLHGLIIRKFVWITLVACVRFEIATKRILISELRGCVSENEGLWMASSLERLILLHALLSADRIGNGIGGGHVSADALGT